MSDADIHVLYDEDGKADGKQPIRHGDRPPSHCHHEHTRVEKEARKVTCRDCGREVDAFDVLYQLAGNVEMYIRSREDAKRRSKQAQEKLLDLERRIRNAKGRLRTAERR